MANAVVRDIMGTVISIDLRGPHQAGEAIDKAFDWLIEVDRRFSPFKPDSEIRRLGRGELTVEECHPDVAELLAICEDLRKKTEGAFNAWRARPDGRLDPSGVVKGWALERAAGILAAGSARNFCINGGGDVVVRGQPEPGRRWRVGIRHPKEPAMVCAVVGATDMAVATSGTYERGHHIVDARSGGPARQLISLTIAGPSMTLADAYATAGLAMGTAGIGWVATQPGYDAYGVTARGEVRYSEGFAARLEP